MLIKINGISIDYRDEGAGIPVIFIHARSLSIRPCGTISWLRYRITVAQSCVQFDAHINTGRARPLARKLS